MLCAHLSISGAEVASVYLPFSYSHNNIKWGFDFILVCTKRDMCLGQNYTSSGQFFDFWYEQHHNYQVKSILWLKNTISKFFIVSTISEISNPDKRELFDMIEDGSRLPPINCVYKIICMRQTITMTRLFLRNYKNSMIICMRQIILKLAKRYEHPNKQCIINE